MKTVKLAELGKQLPIGILRGDDLLRDFHFNKWTMVEEKEIGKRRTTDITQSQFASVVLSVMIDKLAGEQFSEKPESHRRLILNQMYMADALYAYISLRCEALGNVLSMDVVCGNCRATFDFQADLSTMDVAIKESSEELSQEVELKDGFQLENKTVKKLTIHPCRWSVMENLTAEQADNPGELQSHMFANAIIGAEGFEPDVPLGLTSDSFDTMSKNDISLLMAKIDENNSGPLMLVEGKCPRCRTKFANPLRWHYDNFF